MVLFRFLNFTFRVIKIFKNKSMIQAKKNSAIEIFKGLHAFHELTEL